MRFLVLLTFTLALQGCYLLDAYLMTKYDPNEYKIITDIRALASKAKTSCGDEAVSKTLSEELNKSTRLFLLYSEYIPRNKENIQASKSLDEMAHELAERYAKGKVSVIYCKMKFENLETSAKKIQSAIGSRPR